MAKIGLCFSREFSGNDPLGHIGKKLPVYIELLELCSQQGWEVYVNTRQTYLGNGFFNGCWQYQSGQFKPINDIVKIDLLYDRTGGVKFPIANDETMRVVNRRDFKLFCWDKWQAFQKIGQYMPKTFLVKSQDQMASILPLIKTPWIVLKPNSGLKGVGIYVGPKDKALHFQFSEKYPVYIAQEFHDTSCGITEIVEGLHDLRVVMINENIIWSHVRTPPKGSFTANVAQGGTIQDISPQRLPESVKKIAQALAHQFYQEFDNPVFSADFGIGKNGPLIFEINDQMGFPSPDMESKNDFLQELVKNFKSKI